MDYIAIQARVRPSAAAESLGDSQADVLAMNNRRDLMVGQALPERAEITRLGLSYSAIMANAVAAVTAVPTTAAHATWNNTETATGKSHVIDAIHFIVTTASGAAGGMGVVACMNKGAQTAVSTPDTVTICSMNGRAGGGANSLAKFKTSVTITNDGWFPVGGDISGNSGTIAIGSVITIFIDGKIIVPPAGIFSVAALGVNATLAGKFAFSWHEVQMPLVTS